jgi:hypothetical protein
MAKKPLKRDQFFKKLSSYGIQVLRKRGKGSEVILQQPDPSDPRKGPVFSIKDHGKQTEYAVPVINAVLRRFQIDPDEFWS